jgi:hypothetical protein
VSSLLQFNGRTDPKRGVRLMFYHVTESQKFIEYPQPDGTVQRNYYLKGSESCGDETDVIIYRDDKGRRCIQPRIWTAWRKPCGMFGCWVVFRYNGEEHVPDLSVPIATFKLPRDAQPMPIAECIAYWKS